MSKRAVPEIFAIKAFIDCHLLYEEATCVIWEKVTLESKSKIKQLDIWFIL